MRQIEPNIITRGERMQWQRTFGGYPSDEWTLQYRFRGSGPGFDVDATVSGSGFAAEITSGQSTAAEAGQYRWQAWMTSIADTAVKELAASGTIQIEQGFVEGDDADVDLRTPAKIMLDAIDAAMLAFAASDVLEYEIETPAGRRKVKRSDKAMLVSERKYWAGIVTNEIAREGARNGKPLMQSIKIRVYDE